jgi:uncharacterized membrane protein
MHYNFYKKFDNKEHMMKENTLIAVYDNHDDAAWAVETLLQGGINKFHITVLGKGDQEEYDKFEFNKENEDAVFWGEQGAFWGALWGFLLGGLLVFVPGFGPLVASGPLIGSLSGLAAGATVGAALSAMVAWFMDLGMTEVEAKHYEDMLKQGKNLIIVQGSVEEVKKAKALLEKESRGKVKLHLKA